MNQANLLITLGIVLAWSFSWPIIKASKEGPRYLLPGNPALALTFSLICSILALSAIPFAFFSDALNGWLVLIAILVAQVAADGPVWRFLLNTDRLPVLWLAGCVGCVMLAIGYSAIL
jgi:hypothetical protein